MTVTLQGSTLKTYKGDSCQMTFSIHNLNPGVEYECYLQVNFKQPLIKHAPIIADEKGDASIVFSFTALETEVKVGKYTYGLKLCVNGIEDTIKEGTFEVDQKYAEGC